MVTCPAAPKTKMVPAILRRDPGPARLGETRSGISSHGGRGRGKARRIGSADKAGPLRRFDGVEQVVHAYRSFQMVVASRGGAEKR